AAMSIDLKQMSSLLYWFIALMIYFNILFFDNSVALEPYYTASQSHRLQDYNSAVYPISIPKSHALVPDIGFQVTVNQFTYKLVQATKMVPYFNLANAYITGNRIRIFRILDPRSSQKTLTIQYSNKKFQMEWHNTTICQSHPDANFNIYASINDDGTIQYVFIWDAYSIRRNCIFTIDVYEGIFNGSSDGNGVVMEDKVIFQEEFLIPYERSHMSILLVPNARCLAQTTEDACNAELTPNAHCKWCWDSEKCIPSTSLCAFEDQTAT
ncbi:hypothetical protein EWB00_009954, partial [Schistosoma japonicum]